MIKTQFNLHIKCIRTDNGSEFLLTDFYKQLGIIHQTSCVGTPQQNFIIECKHPHVIGITKAILFQAHLTQVFWARVVGLVVHIINRFPTLFLKHKSPYQILYNKLLGITNLKAFGCLCYASTLKENRKKLDSRSIKCIYLGYKPGIKGHIMFDLHCK